MSNKPTKGNPEDTPSEPEHPPPPELKLVETIPPPPEPASQPSGKSTPDATPQPPDEANAEPEPASQHPNRKRRGPEWFKQMPVRKFDDGPDPDFQLVSKKLLADLKIKFKDSKEALARIEADIEFANSKEAFQDFLKFDYQARFEQNRFYSYQILFIFLATVAAIIGALQAVILNNNPNGVPVLGFIEGLVALLTVAIATRQGDSPLPTWIKNRRIAERLRREYFRFLMNLPPYEALEAQPIQRKTLFGERVNAIVSDEFVDEPSVLDLREEQEKK